MHKRRAIARQMAAVESVAEQQDAIVETVASITERQDAIEAKLDRIMEALGIGATDGTDTVPTSEPEAKQADSESAAPADEPEPEEKPTGKKKK